MRICISKDKAVLAIIDTEDLDRAIVAKGIDINILDEAEAFEEPCEANNFTLKLCDRVNLGVFKVR